MPYVPNLLYLLFLQLILETLRFSSSPLGTIFFCFLKKMVLRELVSPEGTYGLTFELADQTTVKITQKLNCVRSQSGWTKASRAETYSLSNWSLSNFILLILFSRRFSIHGARKHKMFSISVRSQRTPNEIQPTGKQSYNHCSI
jgi:hypothetical protein